MGCRDSSVEQMKAPKARDMKARGKREARRPWLSGPYNIEA